MTRLFVVPLPLRLLVPFLLHVAPLRVVRPVEPPFQELEAVAVLYFLFPVLPLPRLLQARFLIPPHLAGNPWVLGSTRRVIRQVRKYEIILVIRSRSLMAFATRF